MTTATDILRFIAISHVLLVVWLFWKERRSQKGTGICLLFGASIAGYLVVDWQPLEQFPALHLPLHVLPFLATLNFWLFSKLLFDDNYRWRQAWGWLMAAVAAFHYLAYFQRRSHFMPLPHSLDVLLGLSVQLVSLTFILLGILEAARNREADLVLRRLQFRTVFIVAAALLMTVTALTEISLDGAGPPPFLNLLQKTAIAGLAMFFAGNVLLFKPGFLPEKEKPAPAEDAAPNISPKESVADERLLEQLSDFMENQKTWRTEGLTIRRLSEKMGVKEYRLRQAINQHLGFRNFNDYLNGYRIREACAVLSDPSKRDLTVLEISYDLGYASLAPFNKAFKDMTGATPTEWRKSCR